MHVQSNSITLCLQDIIASANQPEQQKKAIDTLIETITSSMNGLNLTSEDFKYLPVNTRLIIFDRLLTSYPLLEGLAKMVDSEVRSHLFSKQDYKDSQSSLLNLIIKNDLNGKMKVDSLGLSQEQLEKVFETIPENQRSQIIDLDISNSTQISHLNFLKYFPNLEKLNCQSCSSLKNMEGASYCKKLNKLDLTHCLNLRTLQGLENNQNLKELILKNCQQISSRGFCVLKNLNQLENLNLHGCLSNRDDVIEWDALKNLKKLDLSGNVYLPNFQSFHSLKHLEVLLLPRESIRNGLNGILPTNVDVQYI